MPATILKQYTFKNGCAFFVNHATRYCYTLLPDGKKIDAIATKEQVEHAKQLGYTEAWEMVWQHEFLHNFLAAEKGLPHSTVMHHVANNLGRATDATRYEEAEVLMVQKAINELKKIDRNEDLMNIENSY